MTLRGRTLLAGAMVAAGAGAVAGACSYPAVPPPPANAGAGGSCATDAGAFPPPRCDNTDESCTQASPACPTSPCLDTPAQPCLPLAQNTPGKPADLRIRKLNITAPPALIAAPFLQQGIIDQGVNLKNLCGEGGDGSFSWLIHFDTAAKQVTTGGAPPTADPLHVGYCFVNEVINGLDVKPVTIGVSQSPDGTWFSDLIPKLNVPIYVHGSATNLVILPLTKAKVQGVTLSPDGNCIGSYNPVGAGSLLGMACPDRDPSDCQRWHTAGSLGGYITLVEADGVFIQDLNASLCVLLTRRLSTDATGQHCGRDASGHITASGDFCSQTGTPGGCADSSWLAATFAASAAIINDGSKDPACNGSGVIATDAGADASADASPSDGGATRDAASGAEGASSADAGPG
jgi:hypothetical protein